MRPHWIYSIKLFRTKFHAKVWAMRIEEDYWLKGYPQSPQEVEVFQTENGRYGVRYFW